jgi:hypothetical protein
MYNKTEASASLYSAHHTTEPNRNAQYGIQNVKLREVYMHEIWRVVICEKLKTVEDNVTVPTNLVRYSTSN